MVVSIEVCRKCGRVRVIRDGEDLGWSTADQAPEKTRETDTAELVLCPRCASPHQSGAPRAS